MRAPDTAAAAAAAAAASVDKTAAAAAGGVGSAAAAPAAAYGQDTGIVSTSLCASAPAATTVVKVATVVGPAADYRAATVAPAATAADAVAPAAATAAFTTAAALGSSNPSGVACITPCVYPAGRCRHCRRRCCERGVRARRSKRPVRVIRRGSYWRGARKGPSVCSLPAAILGAARLMFFRAGVRLMFTSGRSDGRHARGAANPALTDMATPSAPPRRIAHRQACSCACLPAAGRGAAHAARHAGRSSVRLVPTPARSRLLALAACARPLDPDASAHATTWPPREACAIIARAAAPCAAAAAAATVADIAVAGGSACHPPTRQLASRAAAAAPGGAITSVVLGLRHAQAAMRACACVIARCMGRPATSTSRHLPPTPQIVHGRRRRYWRMRWMGTAAGALPRSKLSSTAMRANCSRLCRLCRLCSRRQLRGADRARGTGPCPGYARVGEHSRSRRERRANRVASLPENVSKQTKAPAAAAAAAGAADFSSAQLSAPRAETSGAVRAPPPRESGTGSHRRGAARRDGSGVLLRRSGTLGARNFVTSEETRQVIGRAPPLARSCSISPFLSRTQRLLLPAVQLRVV
eukprot:363806-Chlamydomonas_euryale.AAC.3